MASGSQRPHVLSGPTRFAGLDFQWETAETIRVKMSTQEIIAELPKLNRQELAAVDAKVHELLAAAPGEKTVWKSLLELAGTAEGLPPDFAEQHDHYLHGTPKR